MIGLGFGPLLAFSGGGTTSSNLATDLKASGMIDTPRASGMEFDFYEAALLESTMYVYHNESVRCIIQFFHTSNTIFNSST